jgi:hypothetical protein
VPGLDGTLSTEVSDVAGYATCQIVTDLDSYRIGLQKPVHASAIEELSKSLSCWRLSTDDIAGNFVLGGT